MHTIHQEHNHFDWDNAREPVLTISSGETIDIHCLDPSGGFAIQDGASISDFKTKFKGNCLHGPIYVTGAQAGDVLQIDIVELSVGEKGWTIVMDGFGLLANECEARDRIRGELLGRMLDPATMKHWKVGKDYCWFNDHIRIPTEPFCGEIGLALAEKGAHSSIPPRRVGGNIDTKQLTAGSTLYLPIEVAGALLSIGDGHAAQGDGEICGSAIETTMVVKIRVTVHSGATKPYVQTPHFQTTGPPKTQTERDSKGYYTATGVGSDLMEASKEAARAMIAWLHKEHKLSEIDAYMLCSVTCDLKIHEIVDQPNFVVGLSCPLSIFL